LLQLFDDYNQFPCLPCVYCEPTSISGKSCQEDLSSYTLFQLYPSISIDDIAHPSTANKLPTCHSHQQDCNFRVLPKFPKKLTMYLMEKGNIFLLSFCILVWEIDER